MERVKDGRERESEGEREESEREKPGGGGGWRGGERISRQKVI